MTDDDEALRELARQLPWDRPDAARREAVRSQLLVDAAEGVPVRRARWPLAVAVGGVLAAAAAVVIVASMGHGSRARGPAAPIAQVDATPDSDYERHVARTSDRTDEVVRVHRGRLHVAVGELSPSTHVRVATRDAEVEGAGSYDVIALGDELREVDVKAGRAVVRVVGQREVYLAAGDSWKAPVVAAVLVESAGEPASASESVNPSPSPSPNPSPSPSPSPSPNPNPNTAATQPQTGTGTGTGTVAVRTAASSNASTASSIDVFAPAHKTARERTATAAATAAATDTATATASVPATATASASVPATATVSPAAPTAEPAIAVSPHATTPAVSSTSAIEQHFRTGWSLLKTDHPAEAARELGAAADLDPSAPLAADARYLQATALVRAGRKTEAEHALVAFLDHAPSSLRRGRAELQLARLVAERGDTSSARAWFKAAAADGDATVAAAANNGLAALPADATAP
jgi:TolA-binding protein